MTFCSFNSNTGNIDDPIQQFKHAIIFLKAFNDNVCVVGTADSYCTIFVNLRKDSIFGDIVDVFQLNSEHLILVFREFVMVCFKLFMV